MARSVHLLIAAASFRRPNGDVCAPHAPPNLRKLLEQLAPHERIEPGEASPAMPWELALARAHGLDAQPGKVPWAAFDTGTSATPCAWVRPCCWQVGRDRIALADPQALGLSAADSRSLLEAAAPYFAEDGITLTFHAPGLWLGSGEVFRGLSTASVDRAIGGDITPWLPDVALPGGALLRRLQNEMQMLFYTHPVADTRQAAGLPAVNSIWIDGAGVLEAIPAAGDDVIVEHRLRAVALRRDEQAHAAAWQEVDATACAGLLEHLRREGRESVRLTLAGDRAAQTLAAGKTGFFAWIQGVFGLRSAPNLLLQL